MPPSKVDITKDPWKLLLEEEVWLREMAEALRPFADEAEKIPTHANLDLPWQGTALRVRHWLLLYKYVTGSTRG